MKTPKTMLFFGWLLMLPLMAHADSRSYALEIQKLDEADKLLHDGTADYSQMAMAPLDLLQEPPEAPQLEKRQSLRPTQRMAWTNSTRRHDPDGSFQVRCPKGWESVPREVGFVFRKLTPNGEVGIFGVREMRHRQPNEIPPGTPTKVDGLSATEVDSASADDAAIRNVEYFVQPKRGRAYYVVMRASYANWPFFESDFQAILASLNLR